MRMRCAFLGGMLACMVVGFGCRPDEPASGPVAAPAVESPPTPAQLSAGQKAAIERIQTTGAEIELNDAGFPLRIDLASERVFASEALVRATLEFPDLKKLRLAISSVSPETLAELATLTALEDLFLQDAALDDAALMALFQAMPDLKRLTLRRVNGVTDASLDAVASMEQLEVLALIEMNELTGPGLQRLAGSPRLRSLDLRNCGRFTAEDFQQLAALKGLVELKFAGPAVNDDVAEVILGLPNVRSITIEDASISAAFLEKLASRDTTTGRIRTLSFARCLGVPDEAFGAIARFPNLETLSLNDLMVSGAFLHTLSEAGKGPLPLKTLIVAKGFLDESAVARLPELAPNLERLDLRGSVEVTEETRQTLEQLENLKDLKLE